jgi:hypothetical protein
MLGFILLKPDEDDYVKQFEVRVVGGQIHQELWIPAEELEQFNRHIIGRITVEAAYYGENFQDEIESKTNLPKHLKIAN